MVRQRESEIDQLELNLNQSTAEKSVLQSELQKFESEISELENIHSGQLQAI